MYRIAIFIISVLTSAVAKTVAPTENEQSRFNFRNQQQQRFNPASFDKPPHTVFNSNGKPILGLSVELWKAASKAFNFSYDLQTHPIKFAKHSNGSWAGFMGDIVNGKIDCMYSMLGATSERFQSIEYGTFGIALDITFVGRRAVPTTMDWSSFITPFNGSVWLLLGLLITFLISAHYFAIITMLVNVPASHRTIAVSLNATFGPLLGQCVKIIPFFRGPTLVWIFGSLIISNYYTSNLLSHITLPPMENVPRDFEELAKRPDYKIYVMDIPGGVVEVFFQTTQLPSCMNIRQRYKPLKDFSKCVIKAGTEPKTVCIGLSFMLLPLVHRHLGLIRGFQPVFAAEKPAMRQFLHSVLPKKSKYTEAVNFVTGWTRDTGLTGKWFQDVLDFSEKVGRRVLSSGNEGSRRVEDQLERISSAVLFHEALPFKFSHLHMAFGILIVGSFMSLLLFVFETWEKIIEANRDVTRYIFVRPQSELHAADSQGTKEKHGFCRIISDMNNMFVRSTAYLSNELKRKLSKRQQPSVRSIWVAAALKGIFFSDIRNLDVGENGNA